MKKIFILIVILFILILNCAKAQKSFTLKEYFPTGQMTSYTDKKDISNLSILPNVYIANNNNSIIGESVFLKNIEVGTAIKKLNAKIIFIETLKEKDMTILYCFTKKLQNTVIYKGHNINLQIATCEEYTVIGWPMILGSF